MMSALGLEDLALSALRTALAADTVIAEGATRGVHIGNPVASTAPPFVIVDAAIVEDAYTFGGRVFAEALIEVRAVVEHRGPGVPRLVLELAEAARLVMEAGVATSSVQVTGARRVQRVAREDAFDGVRYFNRGGVYRVMIQTP